MVSGAYMSQNKPEGITVYCASSTHAGERLMATARRLGELIALSGHPVITGAGNMGLMGAVNDGAIAAGGTTIGVIPRFMVERGWHHQGLSRLEVVDDMHRRKEMMASLAYGVIALPGGFGTLEELLEIITWRQLGLYNGNIVILSIDGYYDRLLDMFDHAVSSHIINRDHANSLFTVATTPEEAVKQALAEATPFNLSPKF